MSPAERFPRGAEVVERLRLAGYIPGIAGNKPYVRKGPYNRDKVAYNKWMPCLSDPAVSLEAKNYIRLTEASRRRQFEGKGKRKGVRR